MSVKASHELKGLMSRLAKEQADLRVILGELKDLQRKAEVQRQNIQKVEAAIASLKASTDEPIVSEHAILRWIERKYGIDLESIKNEILDEKTVKAIQFAKNGKFQRDGMTIVFRNCSIVTVEPT